jgi:aryl-alcohol dehydrogenase-like predicted oxidoreductase
MFGTLGYEHEDKNDWNQFEDVLGHLKRFIDQGKIRHVGLSNETPWGVNKCLELAKDGTLPRMLSIQNPYSLLNRTFEVGLAEIAIREEIGLLAYSPLASGYLSGKYKNGARPANARITLDPNFWGRYEKPNTEAAVEAYDEIAKKYNLVLSEMALKFCEIQKFMTSVIIGATTMEQLQSNIRSIDVKLTNEIIEDINKVQQLYPNPCP